MKKLSLILFFLSLSIVAQEKPFRERYSYSVDNNNVICKKLHLIVVFNNKNTNEIIFYFQRKKLYLYRTSEMVNGKTETGQDYKAFECIERGTNEKFVIQLLYRQLRVFYKGNHTIYYY